jgi:hypothetical protein
MSIDLWGKPAFVTGRFKAFTRYELDFVLRGHGVRFMVPKVTRNVPYVFCDSADNPKVQPARDLGVEIIPEDQLRKALGAPLSGYRERLQRSFDDWAASNKGHKIKTLTFGAGCNAKTLRRIEERIGFALPEDARSWFSKIDGMTLFRAHKDSPELRKSPLAWSCAVHQDGAFWRALKKKNHFGLAIVPAAETMFFSDVPARLVPPGPAGKLKLGKMTVDSKDLYANLFLLDAFSPHYQAWLYADRKHQRFWALMSSEYGACLTDYHPLSFEAYLEGLATGIGEYRHFIHALRSTPDAYANAPAIRLNALP